MAPGITRQMAETLAGDRPGLAASSTADRVAVMAIVEEAEKAAAAGQ